MAAATTPCPRCAQPIRVRGAKGTCGACGQAVRFVDAPERPCTACAAPVAFPPGRDVVRCAACGAWQATDPARPVEGRTTCPRCGRRVAVPVQARQAPCPHCHAVLALEDAL